MKDLIKILDVIDEPWINTSGQGSNVSPSTSIPSWIYVLIIALTTAVLVLTAALIFVLNKKKK